MKTRSFILILTLVSLTACAPRHRRSESAQTELSSGQELTITNRIPSIYDKNHLANDRTQYQILGVFDPQDIPASIRNLDDQTVIGTLSLIYQNESYLPSYDQGVTPIVTVDQKDLDQKVYLFKQQGQVLFAVQEQSPRVAQVEHSQVKVRSQLMQYCSKYRLYSNYLRDPHFPVINESINCNQNSFCDFTFAINFHGFKNVTRNANTSLSDIHGRKECIEAQPYYQVTETKEALKTPIEAKVKLTGGVHAASVIQFKL